MAKHRNLHQEYTREGLIKRSRFADRLIQLGKKAQAEWSRRDYENFLQFERTGEYGKLTDPQFLHVDAFLSHATVIEASDLIGALGAHADKDLEQLPIAVPCEEFFIEWRDGLDTFGVQFLVFSNKPDPDHTFTGTYAGFSHAYHMSFNGTITELGKGYDIDFYKDRWEWDGWKGEGQEQTQITDKAIRVLRLLSMKNIDLMDIPEKPIYAAEYKERMGVPCVKYKVLGIDMSGKRSTSEKRQLQRLDLRALHSVRGHIRHAPDHPIPQFAGALYVHPHMRGNDKNGVVVKDYRVLP